jgi:hypothetical protein
MLELFCLVARGKDGLSAAERSDVSGEDHPGVSQLNMTEGKHMPAFSFEKIAPPPPLGAEPNGEAPKDDSKRMGVLNRVLDLFVEARIKGLVPPAVVTRTEEVRRD